MSPNEQIQLLRKAQTGAYVTLVLFQMTTAIICQTRTNNLLINNINGIFSNKWLNICLLFELLFTIFIVTNKYTNDLFEMKNISFNSWFYSMPFIIISFFIEELNLN
jgi:magnesium-transporting ATPase (P-type)